MEWSAATAEATQALGLVIEVTEGHEHRVRKHERGVSEHDNIHNRLYIQSIIISILKCSIKCV